MNKAKKISEENGQEFLRSAFAAEQEVLKKQIELSSISITHNGVMGEVNEKYFRDFLKTHLPGRYSVETAIVIDSTGKTSDQIDIVIYDSLYTPTLLGQNNHLYVPIEAVYAVLEVKPTVNKSYLEYAANKAQSVRKLHRTSIPIQTANGEVPAKKLFSILSAIVAPEIEWSGGFNSEAFVENYGELNGDLQVDLGLGLSGECFYFDGNLNVGPSDNSLAFFLFTLLSALQSLGTVPAIDWNQYASALSGIQ